uniref:F-box protein 3 n=1 Tax=Leptobrachium leishanense TaxID=445787 RepID=A0A8C5PRR4_9ANUR
MSPLALTPCAHEPLGADPLRTDPLCGFVNRRINQLSGHDPLWKQHCQKYWLVTENEKAEKIRGWKALFIEYYNDLGRYIDHYAALKMAWYSLKAYLAIRCPRMITSLKDGACEEDLDAVEERIGCKLPNDYRCSFRIHNGQKLVVPGLMGSMALSNHYRSEDLLDIDTAAGGFQRRLGLSSCLPITFCIHTGLSQYLALADAEGRHRNEIFYQCPDQTSHSPPAIDMFITGSSYSQWFTSYVERVVSGGFPIIRDQIFRYEHDKACVAVTDDITVSVSTSFLPELSSIHPPHFFFTYRIRLQMSKKAMPTNSCQLDSRYWRITDANGVTEEVRGPGVVGDYPKLKPGTVYEYTSCTTFSTTSGYMEGSYTFHYLENPTGSFDVVIPRFHMTCPTFKLSRLAVSNYGDCSDLFSSSFIPFRRLIAISCVCKPYSFIPRPLAEIHLVLQRQLACHYPDLLKLTHKHSPVFIAFYGV